MTLRLGLRVDQVVREADTNVKHAAQAGGAAAGYGAGGSGGRTGASAGIEGDATGFPVGAFFF